MNVNMAHGEACVKIKLTDVKSQIIQNTDRRGLIFVSHREKSGQHEPAEGNKSV
jgi:hypothetical protein